MASAEAPTPPRPPFTLRRLDHLVLRVRDLKASLRFYREVLGCTLDRERPDLGLYHLRVGDQLIDLVTLDGPLGRVGGAGPAAEGHNLDHFALQVTPFDEAALRAHLEAHGVAVVEAGQRYGAAGEGPSLYVHDPDGNTVELKGPATA